MKTWQKRLESFLFPAENDDWLACLRIGLGLQVVLYVLSLQVDWNYLFGGAGEGLNGRALSEGLLSTESPLVPRLGWLVVVGTHLGLSESTLLTIIWWALLSVGGSLIVGFLPRGCALTAWFLHLCAVKSGGLVSYGVDQFMTIGLFYLMLSPLPDRYSLDRWLRKRSPRHPEFLGFWRRVLQVHLCFIYFFGGLAKCLGSGWWDGSNLWRALIRPPFNVLPPEMLVHWRFLFPMAGILVCLLELAYPVLIWGRQTKIICLILVCLMHLMIGLAMGMYLFALVMIVLNLAALAPPFQWARRSTLCLS